MSTMSAAVGSGPLRRRSRRTAASPIRAPKKMELPPEVSAVLGNLTDEGRQDFVTELLTAFTAAQETNDLRPVVDVIDAWYRTLLVREHPRYDEMMERVGTQPPKEHVTLEDLRSRLGV